MSSAGRCSNSTSTVLSIGSLGVSDLPKARSNLFAILEREASTLGRFVQVYVSSSEKRYLRLTAAGMKSFFSSSLHSFLTRSFRDFLCIRKVLIFFNL